MTDAPLIPIRFTRTLDRMRHFPEFTSLVPDAIYATTPVGLRGLQDMQESYGEEIVHVEGDDLPVRFWQGEDLSGCRVGYHANGRHGDELIHSSVWRQLQWDHGPVDIHHYALHDTATDNTRISAYNRDIGGMPHRAMAVFTLDQLAYYDYWIVPPNVGHVYRGESEKTQYELLEDHLGITIEQKRPFVWLPGVEKEAVRALLTESLGRMVGGEQVPRVVSDMLDADKGCILVQINASEESRTPSPEAWVSILSRIRKERGELIVVCGDEPEVAAFFAAGGDLPGLLPLSNRKMPSRPYVSAHGILHIASVARVILAPDSFLMHGSAAFGVPCLALWQDDPDVITTERIPSPESRIRHYDNVEAYRFGETDQVASRAIEILNGEVG